MDVDGKKEEKSIDLMQEPLNDIIQIQDNPQPGDIVNQQTSQYFKKMNNVQWEGFEKLKEKVTKQKISFDEKKISISFEKIISMKTGNCYFIFVSFGYFQKTLTLLKLNMSSSFIPRKYLSFGSYAQIFVQKYQNEYYAIKSHKMTQKSLSSFDDNFDKILAQYFICLIASALECGPKIKKLYGFDLICFNDSIEFSMELCQTWSAYSLTEREKLESDLLIGLKNMHSLQLIHRDIKPPNISWSPSFSKWVFLDFGFSCFIKQKAGNKTLTSYRGTYNYASKQLKNLYHLKSPGFVDLYESDLYALKASEFNFIQHDFEIPKNYNSNFFTLLCNMKHEIINQTFEQVQSIYEKHSQFREEFLKLLRIEMDRVEEIKSVKDSQLKVILEKLKSIPVDGEEFQNRDMQMKDFEKEERKIIFKLFTKEEQQNQMSVFLFKNEKSLKKMILQKWDSFSFIKQVFLFFQETLYSNSETAWKRIKLITDIIIEIYIPKCEKKSWVWKFDYLLTKLEQKFLEKNHYSHLGEIVSIYQLINDMEGFTRLDKIYLQQQSEQKKIYQEFSKLYNDISCLSITGLCREKLSRLKQKIRNHNHNNAFINLARLAELMLSPTPINKYQKKQFEVLFEILKKSKSKQGSFQVRIIRFILKWQSSLLQDPKFQILIKEHRDLQPFCLIDSQAYLFELIQKIEESSNFSQQKQYLNLYPILKEVPLNIMLNFYLYTRNSEKINQLASDLILMNKDCLEQIIEELICLQKYWAINGKSQKQVHSILKLFLASYKKKLKKDNGEIIVKYFRFYNMFVHRYADEFFQDHNQLKKQLISSLQYVISYFHSQHLSPVNQIYLLLFSYMSKFYEGNVIRADQFLDTLEKRKRIRYLKENKVAFLEFVRFFSISQNFSQKYYFHNTPLFNEMRENNTISIYFCLISQFFQGTLIAKILDNKKKQVLRLIVEHTKYLTNNEALQYLSFHILKQVIEFNSQNKLQMMKYFLDSEFSLIRQNKYLSAFILMVYLKYESQFQSKLKCKEIKRVYKLSVIRINKLPNFDRIQLNRILKYKFREYEQGIKPRKKRILDRQQDYARNRIFFDKKEFERKIGCKKRCFGNFKACFESKRQKLEQNLKSGKPLHEDLMLFDFKE